MASGIFTPEFVNNETGEFVLVSNHFLGDSEAVDISIRYNRSRILHGAKHLPGHISKCIVIYDVRGQKLPEKVLDQVREGLGDLCEVRIKS